VKDTGNENHQLTVCKVAKEAGLFPGSCHAILTEALGMHWVSATFLLRLLTGSEN
jgi:hypothetical protein